ncbi:hypothetical protein C8J25_11336 [Sphingomonas faeni]|uniref:Uncharacterized protein n=2 Tax=Sphingomonas faeni TaxID=185950 RepID=A0A2T5TXK3_9SPHN|nr:hypothetical protein C8J25_11336 [Sphingomonas faeni]
MTAKSYSQKLIRAINGGHRAALLLFRTGVVSLLYFLTITLILTLDGKFVVAGFVEVQNLCYIISGFASIGFYSILMFYASRSNRLARWSLWQMLAWTPISAGICLLGSAIAEAWTPSVGSLWLAFFALSFTLSTSISGLALGQGRFSLYTVIEVSGAFAFLIIVFSFPDHMNDSFHLNLTYALIALVKFLAYLVMSGLMSKAKSGWSWQSHPSRYLPSLPLVRRFGGPSWLAGTLYIIVYRLMLSMFQGSQGVAAADLAVCWAIFDRLQMIVQVVNTLAFRAIASNPKAARHVIRLSDRYYPATAAIILILAAGGIALWTRLTGSHVTSAALAMAFIFFVWGYRTVLQNILTALRAYNIIIRELAILLVAWVMIMIAQRYVSISWFTIVAGASALIGLSALRTRQWIVQVKENGS